MAEVPYVMFRNNYGEVIKLTRQEYQRSKFIAAGCLCGRCTDCRAVEYVTEVLDGKPEP